MFTEEDVIRWIETGSNKTIGKLVHALYESQTVDEQSSETTHHTNHIGFNSRDAKFGSSIAKSFEHYKNLTDGQAVPCRKLLRKYRKQLAAIANATNAANAAKEVK